MGCYLGVIETPWAVSANSHPPPWSSEIFVVGCFSLWPSSNTEAFNKFIVRNCPINNQNSYISRTECPIYFIPGCKFKFIRCLQTYLRKLIIHFGQWRDPTGPFFIKDPLKLASQDALGSMTVQEGPLGQSRVPQWPKKCSKRFRGARECIMYKWYTKPGFFLKIMRSTLGSL